MDGSRLFTPGSGSAKKPGSIRIRSTRFYTVTFFFFFFFFADRSKLGSSSTILDLKGFNIYPQAIKLYEKKEGEAWGLRIERSWISALDSSHITDWCTVHSWRGDGSHCNYSQGQKLHLVVCTVIQLNNRQGSICFLIYFSVQGEICGFGMKNIDPWQWDKYNW